MTIFFNDTYIEEEFANNKIEQFEKSLTKLMGFSDLIADKRIEYNTKITFKADEKMKTFFSEIDGKIYPLFLRMLDKLNIKYWNENSIQDSNTDYFYFDTVQFPPNSESINDTSLAEASETKKLGNDNTLTLNIPDLKFSKTHVLHVNLVSRADRNSFIPISIDCADCKDSLEFQINKYLSEKFKYTDDTRPPIDEETCLNNGFKFERIAGFVDAGSQVYKDKTVGNYWYIDSIHTGNAAHLEVFDKNGKHVGESDLDGIIDYSKADNTKTIDPR